MADPNHRDLFVARPIAEWHEDDGVCLWWRFPVCEPPYCGNPLDDDWVDGPTHWTPIVVPVPAEAVTAVESAMDNRIRTAYETATFNGWLRF
jgi:hypothetical protein